MPIDRGSCTRRSSIGCSPCQAVAALKRRRFRFKHPLRTLDTTIIELCTTVFDWARFVRTKGVITLHLQLDHQGWLPRWALVTENDVNDVRDVVAEVLASEVHLAMESLEPRRLAPLQPTNLSGSLDLAKCPFWVSAITSIPMQATLFATLPWTAAEATSLEDQVQSRLTRRIDAGRILKGRLFGQQRGRPFCFLDSPPDRSLIHKGLAAQIGRSFGGQPYDSLDALLDGSWGLGAAHVGLDPPWVDGVHRNVIRPASRSKLSGNGVQCDFANTVGRNVMLHVHKRPAPLHSRR